MNKVSTQFFGEMDTNGNRDMIAPVTTTDEVIVNHDSENSITLTERLDQMRPLTISETKPTFECLWGKVIKK